MQQPLAVTIIAGYLGAGKTTLVNHLLRHSNGQRLAVLVNEFGALPIDEDLIEAKDDDLISIAGGCVCCSFGSDLTAALLKLAERFPKPNHVIIECSGVAMPGAIAANIGLLQQYMLAGVVVLADSETIRSHAADEYIGDTVLRQLDEADLIVQTKNDLVDPNYRNVVTRWLTANHTDATVIQAELGNVPKDIILGLLTPREQNNLSPHSDELYDSEVFELSQKCDVDRLGKALSQGSLGVLRAKGFVIDQDGTTQLLQTVGQRFKVSQHSSGAKPQLACIGIRGRFDRLELESVIALAAKTVRS